MRQKPVRGEDCAGGLTLPSQNHAAKAWGSTGLGDSTLGESSREAQSGRRLLGTNGVSLLEIALPSLNLAFGNSICCIVATLKFIEVCNLSLWRTQY